MTQVDKTTADLLALTAQIVTAHVSNNTVTISDIPKLIEQVYGTLANVGSPVPPPPPPQEPAVNPKKSVFRDHIVCLEDGSKHKMLKRHLMTAYGMTPKQYREKWNLDADYPMVAPSYSKIRSALAKKAGLGTKKMRQRGGRSKA